MPDLDAPESFAALDPSGMLGHIAGLPQQCRDAWRSVQGLELPQGYRKARQIVVMGIGGSAIGGDLLRGLLLQECPVPILVHRDYGLPDFVDRRSLVIVCSYSGDTEEALIGLDVALRKGARIVSITTGGELARRSRQQGLPTYLYQLNTQPRAALGYSLLSLLGIVQGLGFVSDKSADVAEAVTVMGQWQTEIKESLASDQNAAKSLAKRLHGRLPVVYGAEHLSEVARRWKGQFNENAKSWSMYDVLPELSHNTVVGYEFPSDMPQKVHVVMLASELHHPRVRLRFGITRELLLKSGFAHDTIEARGRSRLAQVLSLVHFGDYVSYYLAMLYGVDPWSIGNIQLVKERLGKA